MLKARRKDAKSVKIKKNAENVKFKVSHYIKTVLPNCDEIEPCTTPTLTCLRIRSLAELKIYPLKYLKVARKSIY